MPAAFLTKYETGGVFITQSKDLSWYAVITTGMYSPDAPPQQPIASVLFFSEDSIALSKNVGNCDTRDTAFPLTGTGTSERKSAVLALKSLQKLMMLRPCWPSAGPTGGAGFAVPAGITCNKEQFQIIFQ